MEDLEKYRAECDQHYNDLRVSVEKLSTQMDNLVQRVDTLDLLTKDIQELTTSTALLANNMDGMLKEQQRQNARLELLESKPGKRWDAVVDKILMILIGAAVGAILIKLGFQP